MDPFKQLTHGGVLDVAEILFHTRFGYMFPLLAENPDWLLPPGATTQGALLALGTAMATDDLTQANDSTIPAIFTYLGQFIDHNITAQTDREIGISRIATPDGNVMDLTPLPADEVAHKLINGRRPQLDLEQVYGDGPALGTGVNLGETEADILYNMQKELKVVPVPPGFDVPRQADGTAIIADMRNNENLNVSQLQCAFLLFHNNIAQALPGALSSDERYIKARRLARWAYQYVVVNDYLRTVCDPVVVDDVLDNGNRYYAPNSDTAFLPLEFSVAAFRFGHSMIRPAYNLNPTHTGATALPLSQALAVGSLLDASGKLKPEFIVQWHNFAQFAMHPAPQMARRIDPLISQALGKLPVFLPGSQTLLGPLLQQLAQRNLLRGFLLSIPTGQAVAEAMDIRPLSPANLTDGISPAIKSALVAGEFQSATPLWYYILQEARFQQSGNRLGSVGSRIVAETLIGLVRKDRTSYLNNLSDPAVTANGISVASGHVIATIAELLAFAGVPV
ncbi:MAG TPA: heme peroxidase family protein [Stellaceae bacterium]|nr:heme peroxidase family protein [Stellaceae bacterium]